MLMLFGRWTQFDIFFSVSDTSLLPTSMAPRMTVWYYGGLTEVGWLPGQKRKYTKKLLGCGISRRLFTVYIRNAVLPCYEWSMILIWKFLQEPPIEFCRSHQLASAGATNWLLQEPPIGFCRSHQLVSAGATNWLRPFPSMSRKIFFHAETV